MPPVYGVSQKRFPRLALSEIKTFMIEVYRICLNTEALTVAQKEIQVKPIITDHRVKY
jgi:hypothetical protein